MKCHFVTRLIGISAAHFIQQSYLHQSTDNYQHDKTKVASSTLFTLKFFIALSLASFTGYWCNNSLVVLAELP